MSDDKDMENEIKLMKYLAVDKEKFGEFCEWVKEGKIEVHGHNQGDPSIPSKWNIMSKKWNTDYD